MISFWTAVWKQARYSFRPICGEQDEDLADDHSGRTRRRHPPQRPDVVRCHDSGGTGLRWVAADPARPHPGSRNGGAEPPPPSRVRWREPDWDRVHRELQRQKGVTLELLWLEYREAHSDGYQYSWFCERYREWRGTLDVAMRQVYRAGEKAFVDYAGPKFEVCPFLDFRRPCPSPPKSPAPPGRVRRGYRQRDVATPYERFNEMNHQLPPAPASGLPSRSSPGSGSSPYWKRLATSFVDGAPPGRIRSLRPSPWSAACEVLA